MRIIKRLARYTYAVDILRDHVCRAATPDEIEAAHVGGRRCLYMSANGVPLTGQWGSLPEELAYIRILFQLGVRMMHLTYNRRNMLGDGCADPANGGLSDLGRAAIARMNRTGVIVDCAHSGWQTSLEAAKAPRSRWSPATPLRRPRAPHPLQARPRHPRHRRHRRLHRHRLHPEHS